MAPCCVHSLQRNIGRFILALFDERLSALHYTAGNDVYLRDKTDLFCCSLRFINVKVKISPYNATKAYSGNRDVAPVIPYSRARRR